jgi:class 3 adenylate cyclase
MEAQAPYPLPEYPALAEVAAVLNDTGNWAWIVDRHWNTVYVTDEMRLTFGAGTEHVSWAIGHHAFGPEALEASRAWKFGLNTPELMGRFFTLVGGLTLADTPGGRDELRGLVDPSLRGLVDELSPADSPATAARNISASPSIGAGIGGLPVDIRIAPIRIRDDHGLAGTAMVSKPAAGMAVLSSLASMADLGHLERMQSVAKPARRPAAVLFADLEASSPLARRLSTASYFALGRRLVRAADQCVIDERGLVGRHVGDGVAAFFLAESAGSESAAARSCIAASRALRAAIGEVAARSDLAPEDLIMRFGLHWGSTIYVGNITTAGRGEVTALGDEVNEAARIEACASGARALASKELIERLEPADAATLGLDPDRITYTALADLDTATEKARRDAPAIAVCDV